MSRVLLPLLVLALLLSGCVREPEPYTYTTGGRNLDIYPASGTIVDGLDVYRYTRTESGHGEIDYVITYPNGGRYTWSQRKHGTESGGTGINENMYLPAKVLVAALQAGEPEEKVGSPILGLVLIALGALNFFCPELAFRLKYLGERWRFKDAEPSENYLQILKLGGVIFAVIGLFLCFI